MKRSGSYDILVMRKESVIIYTLTSCSSEQVVKCYQIQSVR